MVGVDLGLPTLNEICKGSWRRCKLLLGWGLRPHPHVFKDLVSMGLFSHIMVFMILVWNVRGAAGRDFGLALNEFKRSHHPEFVVLMETRCSGVNAQKVIKRLGFQRSIIEHAVGMSGGIWILWEDPAIDIQVLSQDKQFIHCLITGLGRHPWVFTAVYGSPREVERQVLWDRLTAIANVTHLPWMLAGDFNDIKEAAEQRGGTMINERKCQKFSANIRACQLIDMPSEGPRFTWRGPIYHPAARLYKRLDRSLCNASWRTEFSEAVVTVGPRTHSDHHPLLI